MCVYVYIDIKYRNLSMSIKLLSLDNMLLYKCDLMFNLVLYIFQYFVLPPKIEERFIDFGILSATEASNILFAIINSNPIEVKKESVFILNHI